MLFTGVMARAVDFGLPHRTIAIVLALQLAGTVVEAFGLGMLLPIIQLIQEDQNVERLIATSTMWQWLAGAYRMIGLEIALSTLLITAFCLFLVRQGFNYFRMVFLADARHRLMAGVRAEAFSRGLEARLEHQEHVPLGRTVNDMMGEVDRATNCIFELLSMYGAIILCAVYGVGLLVVSPTLTLSALGAFAISVFSVRRLMSRSQDAGVAIVDAYQVVTTFLFERLKSLRLVRLSSTEEAENKQFRSLVREQRRRLMVFERLRALLAVAIEPMLVAFCFVIIYFGIVQFGLALESLALFVVIVIRLLPVMKSVLTSRQTVLGTMGSFSALDRLFAELATAREEDRGTRPMPHLREGISFDDVHFSYVGTPSKALNGVDLTIRAGEFTAIVGPSGAGKSTLIDMLPRLRTPERGQVLFDGVPVQDIRLRELRQAISYASQTPQMFDVPVAELIRYGRPDASDNDVRRAAEIVGARQFIEALPDGFSTNCGESGVRLSGGQRQRLDLARAVLGADQLLILDEPTSQLDTESEENFREAVLNIRRETGLTIIIVAHRLAVIAPADQIAVLIGGTVTETGRHEELLRNNGWYAKAFEKQMSAQSALAPNNNQVIDTHA